jgi:hypothetical protein
MENFTIKQNYFLLILVIPFTIYLSNCYYTSKLCREHQQQHLPKKLQCEGDFTMLGNTNLTLATYGTTLTIINYMKFVDTDTDPATFNSSKATLELSNAGENSSSQSCSTVLFAGLYWTGKSSATDTFTASRQVQSGQEQ